MEPLLEDIKPFEKCLLCVHHRNLSDPCPPIASLPVAQNKEELIDHLSNPVDPRPLGACESFKAKEELTHNDLADYIQSLYGFKTMIDTHEIYYFKDGIYAPKGEELIIETVEKVKNPCSKSFMNEVINHIQARTFTERELFDKEPYLLTLENGILDINTGLLNDFTPLHLSLVKIPVYYDKEAKCEAIDKYLNEVVAKEDVETLYEIAGYCLLKSYFIHKAFMLIGETHSGKSTYINLLNALIGSKNISHQSLQNLLENRFSRAELFGKLINSYADLPNLALKRTGDFKILTGEDILSAERKHKDFFDFQNNAKLVFSCNEMPRTYDKGDAFYIRWILINFPNRFDDKNPNTDKKLIEKLTTKEELSGFLNQAIARAKILLEQEHFTNNPDVEDIREYYEKLSNPIYAFILDLCIQDGQSEISTSELYQALMKYCEEKRLSKPTLTFVTQELKRLRIEKTRLSDDQRNYAYKGLRWKTEKEKAEAKTLEDY